MPARSSALMRSTMLARRPSFVVALPSFAPNTPVAVIGDSMSYCGGDAQWAWMNYLILLANGVFRYRATTGKGASIAQNGASTNPVGGNMGVASEDTAKYVARKADIALGVGKGVGIFGGIENDGSAVTAATCIANFEEVIAALDPDATIIVTPVAPTKSVLTNATVAARKAAFDSYFANRAQVPGKAKVYFAPNVWRGITLYDVAGATAGPHTQDTGTHQNAIGAALQAQNLWADIAAFFQAGNAQSAPWTNQNTVVDPSGYTLTNTTGATITKTAVTVNGKPGVRIEISGTATAATGAKLARTQTMTVAVGDRLGGDAVLSVTNIAGTGAPIGLNGFQYGVRSGNGRWGSQSYTAAHRSFSDALGVLPLSNRMVRTLEYIEAAGATSIAIELQPTVAVGSTLDIAIVLSEPRAYDVTSQGF